MATGRSTIGFDRKIQLDWLDATADWAAQGLSVAEIRSRLNRLLEGKVAGEGSRGARDKTTTVLLHIWVRVPENLVPLRDDGLALLPGCRGRDRLPLHWGMCLATYPFFRDVAATTGRLLALQERAAFPQITQRVMGRWGDREIVRRSVRNVVRSLVLWGTLKESHDRGVYLPVPPVGVAGQQGLGSWLIEAGLSNSGRSMRPFRSLIAAAEFFPLRLAIAPRDLVSPRLEVSRQGLDEEVVFLAEASRRQSGKDCLS